MNLDPQFRQPYLLCEWHDPESTAVGWIAVYNFVRHFCSGGIRMHPSVTPEEVYRLARAMAYKYKACESLTTGGCKAGIAYDHRAPDAREVLKRFLIAAAPLMNAGVNLGGDLGVDATVVFKIWDEIGVLVPQTKAMRKDPKVIQGTKNHDLLVDMKLDKFNTYDMITGYGVAYAADECWKLRTGKSGGARVVLQGFGCLGASCAYKLQKTGYPVVGIADVHGVVACEDGLDLDLLIDSRKIPGEMNREALPGTYKQLPSAAWLDLDCDILIPAALEDVLNKSNADQVKAEIVVEGANICTTPEADAIFHNKGIDVGVDFTVNLGATRYYDSVIFNVIGPNPQEAIDDVEKIVRKDVQKVYHEAKRSGRPHRVAAEAIFAPDTFDTPDM
jgi:glutamate dehydrogenase (NAD(P)+)